MDVSTIKAGSVIEAQFNDGPNRSGIVIERMHVQGVKTSGKLFGLRCMFYIPEFGGNVEISIEISQVVFVAPVELDFAAIINAAKESAK